MKKGQIFECKECGNLIEVLRAGTCEPECCGKPMTALAENTVDASKEKHLPVIQKTAAGYKVSVGSVPHPMEEKHYIEWIELMADGISYRKFLKPGDVAEAEFAVSAASVGAREHCTLHGLWKA
jgi:superoxide reductase